MINLPRSKIKESADSDSIMRLTSVEGAGYAGGFEAFSGDRLGGLAGGS